MFFLKFIIRIFIRIIRLVLKPIQETYILSKIPKSCEVNSLAKVFFSASFINLHGNAGGIKVGAYSAIRGELMTFANGGEVRIGNYCYIGENTHIWSANIVKIGDRVLISHNVNIFDNDTHPINNAQERHRQFKQIMSSCHPKNIDLNAKPVLIDDDVLIACNSVILSGVHVGEGAVIGAGSVVTKDVLPYTLVAGNPARFIRSLK